MAERVVIRDSSLKVMTPTRDSVSEYYCKTCNAYESQLKKVLEELESARAIIDSLQREAPTTTTIESTCDERTIIKEWTTVKSRNNSSNPKKSSLCKPTLTEQHIVTTNILTPLNNLQDINVESNGLRALQEQKKETGQISTKNTKETPYQHKKE